jgi:PAS domain S-box-containing protein
MFIEGLIINTGLIFSLVMVFCLIVQKWQLWAIKSQLVMGMAFGTITALCMSYPVRFMDGLIFDGRSIVVSMSGLFGGPIAAAIAAAFAVVHRIVIGGVGALTGVGTIITSAGLGIGYFHLRKRYGLRLTALNLYLFGLVVHSIVLAWMLTLPGELKWEVIKRIGIHLILVLPVGSVLLGMVLHRQEENLHNESLLHENQTRNKYLFDNMNEGVAVYKAVNGGEDFVFVDINKGGEKIDKVERVHLMGRSVQDQFPGIKAFGLLDVFQRVWKSGTPEHLPMSFYSDGRISAWRSNYVFKLPSGELVAVYNDETDRINAENQHKQFFRLTLDMLCISGFDGYFKQINPAWQKTFGWSEKEFLSKPWIDFVHPDDLDSTVKAGKRLHTEKETISFKNRYRCKDGSYRWLSWNANPCFQEGLIFAVARDITDTINAQKVLREREQQLQAIFTAADTIAFIVTDANEHEPVILEFSPGAENIFGYEKNEICGQPLSILHTRKELGMSIDAPVILDEKKIGNRREVTLMRKSDEAFPALVSTYSLVDKTRGLYALLSVVIDISEEKRMEATIIQSQKMEAIGALAGGIAHDFNNLLTAITGNAYLALMQLDDHHPVCGELEVIKQAGEKAATLTRQLLAFSRKQFIQPCIVDLNDLLEGLEKILKRLIGEQIDMCFKKEARLNTIMADPGQIEQVIMNLVVNARDAMPGGGKIMIETRHVDLDLEFLQAKGVAGPPGAYALISCQDTGKGMNEEVQSQIFEPFFTTKEVGKGTGMGLSTVYGIVKQSKGYVWAISSPGEGTTFEVYLPMATKDLNYRESQETIEQTCTGHETILVVEDDDGVRELIQTILQRKGYTVLSACNAQEALDISQRHQEFIPLLIADVIMPGLSGPALADLLRPQRPEMRIVFASGYPFDKLDEVGVSDLEKYFLEKPIKPETLLSKVRAVLDEG